MCRPRLGGCRLARWGLYQSGGRSEARPRRRPGVPGGREAFRTEGYLRPFHLAATLDYVGSGAYRAEPSFQRYLQARADRLRAEGKSVQLWD